MSLKTYALLDSTKPSAPIYYQVSPNEKIKIDVLESAKAYRQITFTDSNGTNRTARLKLNANTIWLDEQIKAGIPANEKFTDAEREAVHFKRGILMTNLPIVQQYLEAIPQMEGFQGFAPNGEKPLYKLLDKEMEDEETNELFRERIAAANKIMSLDLKGAQDLLIRINGSFFTPPAKLKECQNKLVYYLDQADNAAAEILKENNTVDDEVNILIGRLVSAKLLSFDAVPDQVVKKGGKGWVNLKEISSKHPLAERKRYFMEFLTSDAGKLLLDDLKKEVDKVVEKTKK